ncbi:MAG: integration host factor subunit beta [Ectothiorhodospiraceae bacterium AqS1]|nr:integration host factor subunit beta [Ectothiorhodospiraceae bacterium AqS1]
MTKSELIDHLAKLQPHLVHRDVELAVNAILRQMANSLAKEERIEVRGFGTFSVRRRPARIGRNPRTGESVAIPTKRVLHFKPGKELRDRVDEGPHPPDPDAGEGPPSTGVQGKSDKTASSRLPEDPLISQSIRNERAGGK